MSNPPTREQYPDCEKFFAIEANNLAWSLLESERDEAMDRQMLQMAEVAAYHWSAAGNELNNMRADMLRAAVHAQLGLKETAFYYAKTMHAFFTARETESWELAFTHLIMAHAALVNDLQDHYQQEYALGLQAYEAIEDPADREIVKLTLDKIPSP